MNGNEKLLAARAEIEAVCKKHDIAAHVILHMPGFFENFGYYTPSYSVLIPVYDKDGFTTALHVRSHSADYKGDTAKRQEHLTATANFLNGVGILLAQDAISLLEVSKAVDSLINATHTDLKPVITNPTRNQP